MLLGSRSLLAAVGLVRCLQTPDPAIIARWGCVIGFFSGLFGGSNSTLDKNIPAFESSAGFASGVGQGDVTAASKWYDSILSGDPTKMAEAVAPETSAIQGQAQQEKNKLAQFAPRSGGTTAAVAGLDANTRAQIIKLLGGLQSGAAGNLSSLGTTEQGVALGGV
jgi:hypothetical protein